MARHRSDSMAKRGFRYVKHIRDALEKAYKENPEMQGYQYKDIASDLGLKTHEVRRWFVLKRYRIKKNTDKKKDKLRNTGDGREEKTKNTDKKKDKLRNRDDRKGDKTSDKTKTLTDTKSDEENKDELEEKGRTIVIVIGEL